MRIYRLLVLFAALTSAAVGFGPLARAEEARTVEQRLEQLDQEIRILKRQRELAGRFALVLR